MSFVGTMYNENLKKINYNRKLRNKLSRKSQICDGQGERKQIKGQR